jgi:hypothetical protein
VVGLTLLGGLQWISDTARFVGHEFVFQLLFVIAVVVLLGIVDLPFSCSASSASRRATASTA